MFNSTVCNPWSEPCASGEQLAFISEDGLVNVLELATHELGQIFELGGSRPVARPDEPSSMVAIAMHWSTNGLVIAHEGGLSLYSCSGIAPAPGSESGFTMTATAPSEVIGAGTTTSIELSIEGATGQILRWLEHESSWGVTSITNELEFVPGWNLPHGEISVTVFASDGITTVSEVVTIHVSARDES
jgi:hypothetical protein